MMEKKLKFVIRKNLPETNSSSSHSVVIESGDMISSEHNFPINDRGCIEISSTQSFEKGGYGRFNDPLTKAQYACGQINDYNKIEYFRTLKIVEEVIKEVTGKDVIFEWVTSYFDTLLNTDKETMNDFIDGYLYEEELLQGPGIDHQSLNLYKEIFENRETLKNFIFNPRSWLFLCDDETSIDLDFYNTVNHPASDPEAYLIVEFNEPVGRVELPINKFPDNLEVGFFNDIKRSLLSCISFDSNTYELKVNNKEGTDLIFQTINLNSWQIVYSNLQGNLTLEVPFKIDSKEFGLLWISETI